MKIKNNENERVLKNGNNESWGKVNHEAMRVR